MHKRRDVADLTAKADCKSIPAAREGMIGLRFEEGLLRFSFGSVLVM
jgi:hypothetical protein